MVSYRKILGEGEEGETIDSTYDCYGSILPRGPQHQALADMLGDSAAAEDENDPPLTCVAHSCLPQGNRPGAIEAFILRRMESSEGATADASTNAAVEGGSSDRPAAKQHRRHVSGSGSAGASSLRVVDSLDSMTIDSIAGLDAPSVAGMRSQPPRAVLVVSGLRVPLPSSFRGSEDTAITVSCERSLNYIPLAVRATTLVQKDGTESVAIFVSDDNACLHLFMPKEESNASSRAVGTGALRPHIILEEVPIVFTSKPNSEIEKSENLLSFSSTIMSIDCLHSEYNTSGSDENESSKDFTPINYVAMGCQDGIVRVVSYTYECCAQSGSKFTVVGSSDLVVDGPIVTLDICSRTRQTQPMADTSTPQKTCTLVVGSLCGFACAFQQSDGAEQYFGEPEEIISNLWCGRIGAEDGVLCVKVISVGGRDGLRDCVAIGTYSGRILVFEQSGEKTSNYKLHWSCQLPYPIHAISAEDLDGDGLNEILVTTRRSIHVFSCKSD